MPPVPLNPNAALLVHSMVPLTPTVLSSMQEEDYLLVQRVRIRATRQVERKINSGGMCYSRTDFDPVLAFDVDARTLSPYGLANWHPGASMNVSELAALPVLAFANGGERFGFDMSKGKNIYEVPVLTLEQGTLPGISFTVTREFSDLVGTPLPLPPPDTVTTVSWPDTPPPDGVNYAVLYGKSLIWYRLINIVGLGGHVLVGSYKAWYSRPVSAGPSPATYSAFRATVDTLPEVPGENEIVEVFRADVPGGSYLRNDAPGDIIRSTLEFGYHFPEPNFNFVIQYETVGGGFGGSLQEPQTDPPITTAAEVADAYPPPLGLTIVAIYALDQAAWLPI